MSGIQKSFIIKNGLEVATNVLLVNSTTRKVGIGSTHPQYDLDVRGGIGVTDINAVGVITALSRLNVGTNGSTLTAIGGSYVGVGTNNPAYLLDVRSPVSTGQTALYVYGDLRVTGDVNIDDISITNLNVSGISTFVGFATFSNNIFVAGIGTVTTLNSTSGTITNLTGTSGTITTFNSTTGNITNLTNTNLNVTGIATIATLNATGIAVTNFTVYNNLSVGGISTFTNGPVLIGSGTSTGTASQRLQVTGGTYVSGNLGIGSTNPTSKLNVIGGVIVTGVITATTFVGALTGTATSTTNIPNLTGDITSVNSVTSIAAGVIVNADINASAGIVDTKLATISTALKVSNSATTATNANTASAIVARDASGNFSAGTITASLTGTATSTTNIPNLTGAITSNNTTTSLGSFTSAQLATALTDETGSGSAVFATSPTLVTPVLGTPQSGTLTSCTGLPVSTGISGLAANVATFLGTPSSANLASAVTDETGTGALVFATSPTLVTPVLGAATATSIVVGSGVTINASGINAAGIITATTFIGNMNAGVGTITTLSSTNGTITNLTGTAGTITTFNSTSGTITNLTGTAATIGTVKIVSGIITATSGIVTYFGDGQYLQNIISGVGILTVFGRTADTQILV